MTIESPGTLTVECDGNGCGDTIEVDVTEFAGQPQSWGLDDETIEAHGWTVDGQEHFCPSCSEKD